MSPTIRRAGPGDDFAVILALVRDAFAYMDGVVDPPSSIHRVTAAELERAAQEEVVLLALDPALAGVVRLTPKPGALYLGKLAVRHDLRGRGIARALVAAAEAEARARGLPALELRTRVELTDNHATFARLGFRETGRSAHPGYASPTTLQFRKDLP
jgi:GNAT superfamily N-acetyltransferase